MNQAVAVAPNAKMSLFYSEGSSNKEYHAEVMEMDDGFVVNFRYGRRGTSLACGSKTPQPVALDKAMKIYEKLINEKMSKGYTPDVSGAAYQGTEKAGNKTDFVPQLLNAITEEEAMRLIEDPEWGAQEKKDGERRGAEAIEDGTATGMNRKGLAVPLPLNIANELANIALRDGVTRIDGEIIGERLYVFDILMHKGVSVRNQPYDVRAAIAEDVIAGASSMEFVPVAFTTEAKRALWHSVKQKNGEGVVFKRIAAAVSEGRPASGGSWLKFKFTERASCIVASIHSSKRSVGLKLRSVTLEAAGATNPYTEIGNVTIPPNADMPKIGDVVEVEYLYAYLGGSLFQPIYCGQRTDVSEDECTLKQLKYKPETAA